MGKPLRAGQQGCEKSKDRLGSKALREPEMPHKGSRVLEENQAQNLEIKGLGVDLGFGTNRPAESEQITCPRNSSRPNSEAALRPWGSARLLRQGAAPETLRAADSASPPQPQLRPPRGAPRAAPTSPAVRPLRRQRSHRPPPGPPERRRLQPVGSRAAGPAAAAAAGPMGSAAVAGGGSRRPSASRPDRSLLRPEPR